MSKTRSNIQVILKVFLIILTLSPLLFHFENSEHYNLVLLCYVVLIVLLSYFFSVSLVKLNGNYDEIENVEVVLDRREFCFKSSDVKMSFGELIELEFNGVCGSNFSRVGIEISDGISKLIFRKDARIKEYEILVENKRQFNVLQAIVRSKGQNLIDYHFKYFKFK